MNKNKINYTVMLAMIYGLTYNQYKSYEGIRGKVKWAKKKGKKRGIK